MNLKNLAGYLICLLAGAGITYLVLAKEKTETTPVQTGTDASTAKLQESSTLIDKMLGPVPKDTAEQWIGEYRRSAGGPDKTTAIWHEPAEVNAYIESIFNVYAPQIEPPAGYAWKLAMSPMHVGYRGKKRLTICFLPCLVSVTDPTKGYEYFEEKTKNSAIYKTYFEPLYRSIKSYTFRDKQITDPGFIFDEGQLWP